MVAFLLALSIASIHVWLKEKKYLFSEDILTEIGGQALKKHGSYIGPTVAIIRTHLLFGFYLPGLI